MKKILLLTILVFILNGCRYIQTKEPYLEASESPELAIPQGIDSPNSTTLLQVPKARNDKEIVTEQNNKPPEMPIRTRQSKNGIVRIENQDGFPVLVVKTSKENMLTAMGQLDLENWTINNKNAEDCQVIISYFDQDAFERENRNFVRKLFTRDDLYSDNSGDYKLSCSQSGDYTRAKFTTNDGSRAKTYLADNIMNTLFEQFEKQ